jgi:hypothetical protein
MQKKGTIFAEQNSKMALSSKLKVDFHTHANHFLDWRGADALLEPEGLPPCQRRL